MVYLIEYDDQNKTYCFENLENDIEKTPDGWYIAGSKIKLDHNTMREVPGSCDEIYGQGESKGQGESNYEDIDQSLLGKKIGNKSFYDIENGETVLLIDSQCGLEYSPYTYNKKNDIHIFTPKNEYNDTILQTDLKKVQENNNPLMINGDLFSNYELDDLCFKYNRCYKHNSIKYPNVDILPIDSLIENPDRYPLKQENLEVMKSAVFLQPIHINANRMITNGYHRFQYSKDKGYTHIPVEVV
jgi:Predicted transcriptional regulators